MKKCNHLLQKNFKEYIIIVTKEYCHCSIRIDKFLSYVLSISRNKIQETISNQLVIINKRIAKSNYRVQYKDKIIAYIPNPINLEIVIPEKIPLNIIYEDSHILVINKPAQMIVYPDTAHRNGTLANALVYHYNNLPLRDGIPTRPGLVHRIDKNTSGILVVAKTKESLVSLVSQFYKHTITRIYYALVWGNPKYNKGIIDLNIGKDKSNPKKISVFQDKKLGKKAITHYKVIKRLEYVAFVSCRLETGRTHQIRVHMKHIGHPIFGDVQYGGNKIIYGQNNTSYKAFITNCFKLIPHQALHATFLRFNHPFTNIPISFKASLPENFIKLLDKWENYKK